MGMRITIQSKGAESAPIVIDTDAKSVESTTVTFPKLSSAETGKGKSFSSIKDAMNSSIFSTLTNEVKGWLGRQNKYKQASKQEAESNKQAVWNKWFSYNRKTASSNSREIQYATKNGVMFTLYIVGSGSYDYIGVFCPVVNTTNNKVIFKPCGHLWVSENATTEKSYDSLIAAQESFIDSMFAGDIEA